MCSVLCVSPSGYYTWLDRAPSKRSMDDAVLVERIRAIQAESDATYGMRRVRAEQIDQGGEDQWQARVPAAIAWRAPHLRYISLHLRSSIRLENQVSNRPRYNVKPNFNFRPVPVPDLRHDLLQHHAVRCRGDQRVGIDLQQEPTSNCIGRCASDRRHVPSVASTTLLQRQARIARGESLGLRLREGHHATHVVADLPPMEGPRATSGVVPTKVGAKRCVGAPLHCIRVVQPLPLAQQLGF